MFIFDDLAAKVDEINNKYVAKSLNVDLNQTFPENPNQFIFSDDKAFELGANPCKGIALDLLLDLPLEDQILLLGEDLRDISKNKNYARITLASVDKDQIGSGNDLYNSIRKFDYVKYHLSYEGVMVRESVFNKKESLLVSKSALKKGGLDFAKLGSYVIAKHKELPFVKNVKAIFVNLDDYDYEGIAELLRKCESITKALDHLTNKVKMDCHSCAVQVICNEVEKKVKEDFKKN